MARTIKLTAQDLRRLARNPQEMLALAEQLDTQARACTGLAASWCPVHGDCSCPEPESAMDHPGCALHGAHSTHAD